jgi:hypothetical protein
MAGVLDGYGSSGSCEVNREDILSEMKRFSKRICHLLCKELHNSLCREWYVTDSNAVGIGCRSATESSQSKY